MRNDQPETLLLHDLHGDAFSGMVPALYQTSLFTFGSFSEMRSTLQGENERYIYTRGRNPTVQAFEEKVAQIEGAQAACAFSSGMAAIAASVLANVHGGDRIVCVRHVYPDAYKLLTRFLPKFGVYTDFVDGTDTEAVISNLDGAKLLYLESPTSLTFELQDVATLTQAARERGVTTILDNSWATPLFQTPLEHGVDLVVHSASKYLSGHSDVVAGILLGSREVISKVRDSELMILGGKLSPFEAWLLLRGLRTLPLRLEQHHRSALEVARYLKAQDSVARVHYPGLESHPQHTLYQRYFSGSSGLLSFELTDERNVEPFVDALRLFRLGVSWGGYESLVYPALLGHLTGGDDSAIRAFNIPRTLIRLHVGIEHVNDLITDLSGAFASLKGEAMRAW